ncbi:MAG: hypothetical protein HYU81_00500 [Candidatus Brennerbacteria bacterium]|nr:hypothetical protein [Candidatus Brennerbacteria bacterium]
MKKSVILYHANCPDGFGAAWAAWKKFGGRAEYIPIPATQDGRQLNGVATKDREVYLLDVCVPLSDLLKLRMKSRKVIVIDHHATSASIATHATEHLFDVKHSGAVLAWQYFNPQKKLPALLKYIEDGDLWRWKLPQSKIFLSYVYSRPFDFKEYEVLARGAESVRERKRYLLLGKALADYNGTLVREAVAKAELVQFGKYKILAVNSTSKRSHSEVGHALCEKRPPLGIVWRIERGMIEVSLRGDGSVDVSKLAKQFSGGGGHPNAAGFSAPLAKGFPWRWLL